ncbi:MAG: LysE family transporter [Betaproteobacteria bacterium]|nr:LysE family transporter [Betaproteobacteria bacterium]
MFGITDSGAYVLAVIVFLAIPGPGNLALLTSTAQGGLRGGLLATLGVIAGDQVLIWAAVAGMAALLLAMPVLFGLLQWAGALYLIWLGVRLIRATDAGGAVISMSSGRYFRQSLLITVLNPKAIVFYLAFFPLFIDPQQHRGLLTFAVMAFIAAFLTFLYGLILCSVAIRVSASWGGRPRLGRWLNRLAGLVMIGFGLRMILVR